MLLTRKQLGSASAAVLGAALLGGLSVAQEPKPQPKSEPGAAQRIGERIDQTVQDIKKGVKEASSTLTERFHRARASVQNMNIEARVYGRLHWDKELHDATIELEATKDGVITLKGSVPDAVARARAMSLTRDTVGVTDVVDQLALSPPKTRDTRTNTTPPPAERR